MRTVILGPPPPEIEALIESRRRTGADHHDEVWGGDLHMNPAPRNRHSILAGRIFRLLDDYGRPKQLCATTEINIGVSDDHRIPDLALLRSEVDELWNPSAALVVEILSPHDESWQKLPFYAARGVAEAVIVDPVERAVTWLRSEAGRFVPTARSELLDVDVAELAAQIDWPPVADDDNA